MVEVKVGINILVLDGRGVMVRVRVDVWIKVATIGTGWVHDVKNKKARVNKRTFFIVVLSTLAKH